ncbi:MAG: prepilin-type N-terminal cleavage/methylation domain-containing protein [Sedimentisphaerales bacterium]|nr:prepilin-type N-terminal cleavage/methylation domain-containing protein [Sedimentisphaerales bacterium]
MVTGSKTVHTCGIRYKRKNAYTLTEMLVVIIIISLLLLLAQVNIFTMLRRNSFKSEVQLLVSTMQSAINAASQSERRYEFIVDITEQSFLLREITTSDLSEVLEDEIIINENLSDKCIVVFVEFDDGDSTFDGRAKFRAGHAGWAYGGKIVLQDEYDQKYSIVVNRMDRIVTLKKGDYTLLKPIPKDDLST